MSDHEARRAELKRRYMRDDADAPRLTTGGVDHLALICSDMEKTIDFYTQVMGMRLVKVIQNRDDPPSTHIFLDMGGDNEIVCPYCSTLYVYNSDLAADESSPADCTWNPKAA